MAILELIGYLILDVLFFGTPELLIDVGVRRVKSKKPDMYGVNSVFAFVIYAVLGYVLGAASAYFFPHHFISNPSIRAINLFLLPILAGVVMSKIGKLLKERGKFVTHLESFSHGFAFAFCFVFARYVFAK